MARIACSFSDGIGSLKIFDGLSPPALPRDAAAEAHQVECDLGCGADILIEPQGIVVGLLRGFEILQFESGVRDPGDANWLLRFV
jgi:hypothetical protein